MVTVSTFYCRFVSRIQPTKQRPPQKGIYLTKNQHLHQHSSTLLSTILTIEYHFQFGEIYINIHKYTSKTRYGSAKKTSKTPLFFAKGFQQVHGFNPPALAETHHHGHGRHLTQDSLHSRIPGSRHGTGARHDLSTASQWVLYQAWGEKNPFSEWLCSLTFFYFEEIFFKPAIFFSVAGILVMSCYVRS